ncbi:TPA: DUF4435 domain-containing protein [Streptococcus suis 2651]|uniref:DUF4435 domain-containing protein n=1 Tax=Streptococcus suis TaxID=1307 RepID=UPI0004086F05|nr:DUF4435 domain-containing protein [Streptococcus suis]HEL1670362.1 DUF4435 domain-containing protein [Streptococcus suis]HEL1755643.1 DUF4435 domain-containing protein [Streptococcus suis]HEM3221801.1 DUF4435 domain-containing protein [Streptococcus suis 2651]
MNSFLKHSNQALHVRQKFLEKANDFNLYVEDTGYEYWYKEIFRRMGFKLVSVVASGDKNRVVADYRKYGSKTDTGKLNFYITDGDFWRYKCPEKMIKDDCFIYLETYNIESYFVDKTYSIRFLKGRLHTDDDGVKKSGFDFDRWEQRIVNESKDLFFTYVAIECLTARLGGSNPQFSHEIGRTVSDVTRFLNFGTGFVNQTNWTNEITRIEEIINNHNLSKEFSQTMQVIKNNYYVINQEEYYNLICGKYLFDSLCAYIQSVLISNSARSAINKRDFKWECINSFDISKLDYVKSIIANQLLTSA